MIVKKMLISQGFPDFESVKFLSGSGVKKEDFYPVFYDIETTGLSRNSTFLYLIGAAAWEDGQWYLHQWMAESQKEEETVLKAFSQFLEHFTWLISYNGEHFDTPYLEARYALYGLPSPFPGKNSLDLYLKLKPLKKLLKLDSLKQPCLEAFLGMGSRLYMDGKNCIRLYKSFLKGHQSSDAQDILGHNLEDVLGLGRIFLMLGYLAPYRGTYEIEAFCLEEEHLLIRLTLPIPLPRAFSNGTEDFYLTGEEESLRLIIKGCEGRFRQYYPNYRDYDYLPAEDTAIPKALSACMDKKLRKAATKDTCYTWFTCNEVFLNNPISQKQYLSHTLPYLLGTLK